jgi:hypothetical protein
MKNKMYYYKERKKQKHFKINIPIILKTSYKLRKFVNNEI